MSQEKRLAGRETGELERYEPWNTFRDMERMFRDFLSPFPFTGQRWLMPEIGRQMVPDVDLKETETEFLVSAAMPGMEKNEIDIDVTDDTITISGERKHEEERPEEKYHIRRQTYGSFRFQYTLPAEVKAEEVKANYHNGVLHVTLPKAEVKAAHKVKVDVQE